MSNSVLPVIVFSGRNIVVNAFRKTLMDMKWEGEKEFVKTSKACLSTVTRFDEAIIVLDWEVGVDKVIKFFKSLANEAKREGWLIYLVANEQSEKIIAAGSEFGVNKVQTGSPNPVSMKLAIEELARVAAEDNPLRPMMEKIQTCRIDGNWEEASKMLETLSQQNSDSIRIKYELGENYLQEKKWQQCYDLLSPLAEMDPPDSRVLHSLGKAMIKIGKKEEAIALLEKAQLINPFNIDRLITMGQTLLNMNKVEEAGEKFKEANEIDSENSEAIKGEGTCKLIDGDVNDVLKLLRNQVTGRELASILNTAAILAMRAGTFEKGIELYESAEPLLDGFDDILAKVVFNKGIGFYQWEKLDEAKVCFEKALELDPEYENAKVNLKVIEGGHAKPSSQPISDESAEGKTDQAEGTEVVSRENADDAGIDMMVDDGFDSLFDDDDEDSEEQEVS